MTKNEKGTVVLIGLYFFLIAVFQFVWIPWPFVDRIGASFLMVTGAIAVVLLGALACKKINEWYDKDDE